MTAFNGKLSLSLLLFQVIQSALRNRWEVQENCSDHIFQSLPHASPNCDYLTVYTFCDKSFPSSIVFQWLSGGGLVHYAYDGFPRVRKPASFSGASQETCLKCKTTRFFCVSPLQKSNGRSQGHIIINSFIAKVQIVRPSHGYQTVRDYSSVKFLSVFF